MSIGQANRVHSLFSCAMLDCEAIQAEDWIIVLMAALLVIVAAVTTDVGGSSPLSFGCEHSLRIGSLADAYDQKFQGLSRAQG